MRPPGTEGRAGLYTGDAIYLQSPYEHPVIGWPGLPALFGASAARQPKTITGHPLGADRVCRVPSSTSQSDELDRGEFFQAFWAAFQADAALLDASLGEFHA
jgi:hypothetical protein